VTAWIIGLAPLFTKRQRRTVDGTIMWSLIWLIAGTLIIAWLASQITPAFVARYMAPLLPAILMLAAWGMARSGVVGLVMVALVAAFVVHLSSYAPRYKSDMQDISGEVTPLLLRAAGLVLPPGRAPVRHNDRPREEQRRELHGLGPCAQAAARRSGGRDPQSAGC
jgi:hypothetical protein